MINVRSRAHTHTHTRRTVQDNGTKQRLEGMLSKRERAWNGVVKEIYRVVHTLQCMQCTKKRIAKTVRILLLECKCKNRRKSSRSTIREKWIGGKRQKEWERECKQNKSNGLFAVLTKHKCRVHKRARAHSLQFSVRSPISALLLHMQSKKKKKCRMEKGKQLKYLQFLM